MAAGANTNPTLGHSRHFWRVRQMSAAKQTLFDHFVRAGEHRCRQIETDRLGGFQIDHQLVLGRRLHRQISRLRSDPYQRNHGPCWSGPNVSVLFVQSSDEVAGRSLAGASASVKSDAECPRCLALHFWI